MSTLQAAGVVPILELHWATPGAMPATWQEQMLNRDHSITYWQQVAAECKSNAGVVFDPYNEPYPDGNKHSAAAWDC